jgi:hypothetical protein
MYHNRNIPTVNTTTNFPAKTVAGNYLLKQYRSTPTPLQHDRST